MPAETPMRRIGILLAAGRGRRMGGTKQLHPWRTSSGEKLLVAAAFDAVCGVCDEMVVALGHEAEAVAAALATRSFHQAHCDPDAAMFESIRAGLRKAREIDPAAQILLYPADHPEVAPATLDALIAATGEDPDCAVLPEYRGRGGHPALIPHTLAERLLTAVCPQGLRQFWQEHPALCVRLPVDDPSAIRDLDTVEDSSR